MNIGSKLTLYDTLTYSIIGCLIFILCRIFPTVFAPNNWLFYLTAYIVGFVFAKLTENAFWFKHIRNPKCCITFGYAKVLKDSKDCIKDRYLKDYYSLSGKKTYNTITILEAYFAFIYNLAILSFIAIIKHLIEPNFIEYIKDKMLLDSETISALNNCCSNCPILLNTQPEYCQLSIILIFLFLCVLAGSCFKKEESEKKKCNLKCNCIHCILTILIAALLVLYIAIKCRLLLLILATFLLAYICFIIQKKICFLVAEGAYYNDQNTNHKRPVNPSGDDSSEKNYNNTKNDSNKEDIRNISINQTINIS